MKTGNFRRKSLKFLRVFFFYIANIQFNCRNVIRINQSRSMLGFPKWDGTDYSYSITHIVNFNTPQKLFRIFFFCFYRFWSAFWKSESVLPKLLNLLYPTKIIKCLKFG